MFKPKKRASKIAAVQSAQDPIDYLVNFPGLWRMNEFQRRDMTISCRDTDYIKKVKDAGKIKKLDGKTVQIMHNGLIVQSGGYHGTWMNEIITALNGHHEPQEEKAFYEVMKRLKSGATMIELGSFWAYYSLWFKKELKNSTAICCEPDPDNMKIGKSNAVLNSIDDAIFVASAAGDDDGAMTDVVMDSDPSKKVTVPIRTVDSLVKEHELKQLDLLHMDVQGFEMSALRGTEELIKAKKLRFLFVSTHHYFFSGKANTHQEVLHFIRERGGHIIMAHTIAESFSGDGLIVASFDKRDKDFVIDSSINHTDQSLFRSYEEDIALLADLYRNRQ